MCGLSMFVDKVSIDMERRHSGYNFYEIKNQQGLKEELKRKTKFQMVCENLKRVLMGVVKVGKILK